MVNCVIVHGCPDKEEDKSPDKRTYDKHWIPWLKARLEEKDIHTEVPIMPTPWEAKYEKWKEVFDKLNVNEDSILIGHSCGASFLVRWLGDTGKKVKKLLLVAPWKILYGDYWNKEDKVQFYGYDINENIRDNVGEIIIFSADDEHKAGKETAKLISEKLNGKIIELKKHGHYTLEYMGTEEFPELLEEVLRGLKDGN